MHTQVEIGRFFEVEGKGIVVFEKDIGSGSEDDDSHQSSSSCHAKKTFMFLNRLCSLFGHTPGKRPLLLLHAAADVVVVQEEMLMKIRKNE